MSFILASLIGMTFDTALRHTRYDPSSFRAFAETLNGPQTPATRVNLDGHDIIVFETCTAHLCASQHSVVAIDMVTDEKYVASYRDDGIVHIASASFGPQIDQACSDQSCDFPSPVVRGPPITLQPLGADYEGACRVTVAGKPVLITGDHGIVRYQGKLRPLYQRGTDLYTGGGTPALRIVIQPVNKNQVVVNILDNGWHSALGVMKCR